MATMKTNRFEKVSIHSTQKLLSLSLESNRDKRPLSHQYSNQISPFVDLTTQSMNSINQRTATVMDSHRRRCHRKVQSIPIQNLMQKSKGTLAEPTIKPHDKQINTDKLSFESSSKTCLSESDQSRNIISDTSLLSNGKNNKFLNFSFQPASFNREYDQTSEHHNKKKKKRRRRRCCSGDSCCPCSLLRLFLLAICLIILGTIIAAIIIGITMSQKTTTKILISTSTVTTSTRTTETTTSTSTTSTTTITTTTTTTAYKCNSTCLNQTWQSSSNILSEWLFDGTFNDQTATYNATPSNNVTFTNNGYVEQAAVFTVNANQILIAPYIPLAYTSFTIETWIYMTGLFNIQDHSIFGLCPVAASHQCLHLTIRRASPNYYLYLGFYDDDCQGSTPLTLNTWIHAAFVFDMINMRQLIYLNGILDMTCSTTSGLTTTTGSVNIGYIPMLPIGSINNYFQGYIDQLTVSTRAKSSCEILEDATLAAYFTFNGGLLLSDSGPNSLQATTQSTSSVSSGHFAQALTFSGSSSSYFQISDLTTLGISNRSFSISLWIRPTSLSGVLVHVSSNTSGLGWCLPFIGFATNGSLVAQIQNANGVISVLGPSISVTTSTWSHIVQTWSATNGLRLYIDNILVASRISLATTYTSSTIPNYLTLGNTRDGTNSTCGQGQLGTLTPYQGDIDDFRVYSRELTATDVCTLYIA